MPWKSNPNVHPGGDTPTQKNYRTLLICIKAQEYVGNEILECSAKHEKHNVRSVWIICQ